MLLREMYRTLGQLREAAVRERIPQSELFEVVDEVIEKDANQLNSMSVRKIFECTVRDGAQRIQDMDPNGKGGTTFRESADAVSTEMFAHTMGQIIYTRVLDAYQMPELIGDALMPTVQTNFSGERVPGVTRIGDEVEVTEEGRPFSSAIVGESYVDTPETRKRGLIVDVTKESVFFDRTNLILARAGAVGTEVAVNREKRILDVVTGVATVYSRNGRPIEATYQADNTSTANPLVDWTSVDAADQVFNDLEDPDTGEPLVVTPNTLVVPLGLRNVSGRIINATWTNQRSGASGYNETRVEDASLNNAPLRVLSNQYVKLRSGDPDTWFYGRPEAAFAYMQNFPLQVLTQSASSEQSFERDIVSRSRASERGTPAVLERRYMLKAVAS